MSQIKLLLDRSLIENGAFTPQFEFTPVNRIVHDCTRILKQQAQVKDICIAMNPMKREMILKIDPLRVQQVVINFLSNAIKFSPEGSQITVKVKNYPDKEKKEHKIKVQVVDQGIGMNETDVKNLCQPYFKSSDKANRDMNSQGHGLGLSICKMIASKLDGSIQAKSEHGKGTVMSFFFRAEMTNDGQFSHP